MSASSTDPLRIAVFGAGPVDAGPLGQAKNLEAMARLVIHMAYEQGKGPMFYWFGRQRPGEFG